MLPSTKAHMYTVRKGDEWRKIAGRELGNPERWVELMEMNGSKTDAWLKANVGKKIRIMESLVYGPSSIAPVRVIGKKRQPGSR
jgi:hypothetical protein